MSRQESVSPEGLRVDGRRPPELRRISSKTGVFLQADGSAYIELGNTKCLAAVYGPHEPPTRRRENQNNSPTVTVEFNIASFSSGERKKQLRVDRRRLEIATIIKQTFEPVIMLSHASRCEIEIYLQILQIDGGALHAAINAACMALIDAGIPLSDYVCACSAGFANGAPIVDLNYVEESAEVPILTVAVLPKSGTVAMINSESKLHLDNFEMVLRLATAGATQIYESLNETIKTITNEKARKAALI